MVMVRPALRQRLGEPASEDLVDMFAEAHALATASFERRLTEEVSRLRVDFAQELGRLRAELSRELATTRVDQFKWSFAFWLGQVATTAGLLAYMLRA